MADNNPPWVTTPIQGATNQPPWMTSPITNTPGPTSPKPKPRIQNIGRGMQGAFTHASMSGLMTQPVRWAMEAVDFGGYKKKIRDRFPGKTEEWYDQQIDKLYDQAILASRAQAQKQMEDNPYPGQTVGNFAAGIAGSAGPDWFIAPGVGLARGALTGSGRQVAANVARHVGKQAAVQGGVGGVTDLVTQGMDIGEGIQEGIDGGRLLTAAGFGAGFGAGFAGVQAGIHHPRTQRAIQESNAPQWVKAAFTDRTAAPDEPAFQSQVGMEHAALTPEQQSRQRQVFTTGTADDIDAFYNEVGGARPSRESVDKWIEERSKMEVPGAPKPEVIARQAHRDNIRAHMDDATKTWKNKPSINIYDSLDDMTPEMRASAQADGITPENTVGFLGTDGQVHLFAGQIKTPEAANAVLFHEALGHYGLAQRFGTKLDNVLNTLVTRNVGQFGKQVDKWMKDHPNAYGGDRIRAAEEVLAEMSENGRIPKAISDAIVSSIRQFARGMGVDLKYSDTEVKHILAMAHDAVVNGKGRDVIANRFGGLAYQATDFGESEPNRQMYVGRQAYDVPNEGQMWFEGPDGSFRLEISDHEASWNYGLDSGDLDEFLRHPKLFKAYPELRNVKVVKEDLGMDYGGAFYPGENKIVISTANSEPMSTALHEIQHWIQYKEDWGVGGMVKHMRLDKIDNLNKLEAYYTRLIDEMPTNTGDKRWDVQRDIVQKKLRQVKELQESSADLTQLYDTLNAADRRLKDLQIASERYQQQISSIADQIKGKVLSMDELRQLSKVRDETWTKFNETIEKRLKLNTQLTKLRKGLTDIKGKYSNISFDMYSLLTGEVEARDVQARQYMTPEERARTVPYASQGILPEEMITRFQSEGMSAAGSSAPPWTQETPDIDTLRANPRFWSDPEYRANVIEYMRTQHAPATGPGESAIPAASGFASEAEARVAMGNRRMSAEDEPAPLPFTARDVDISRRIRDRLRSGSDPRNPLAMGPEFRTRYEDEHARVYGDAEQEIDRVAERWQQDSVDSLEPNTELSPVLADHINVYDNRTGQVVGTFQDRADAFAFISEAGPDAQFLGIDRVGTDKKFMTPEQLQRRLDDGTSDLQQIDRLYNDVYNAMPHPKRSDEEVRRAARAAGFARDKVKDMGSMEDLSARIYRAQEAAKVLDKRISQLADLEGTDEWSQRHANEARRAIADHYYILQRLYDDKSELGRAMRIAKLGYTHAEMRAYKELLAEEGGPLSPLADDDTLNRFLRSFKTVNQGGANPNGVNALVMGMKKPNWEEYLLSARVNMMLSGMSTHVTAVTDMIDGIGYDLMDSTAGLIPSLGREGLRALGFKVSPGLHPAEVGARYWGVLRAAMEAQTYVQALKTLQHGSQRHTSGGRQYARIPILSKVGDLIAAEDQFFRAFATNMHLYGLGVRRAVEEARAQGKKPSIDDLITAGTSYARNPDPTLLREAQRAAEENLLLAPNMLVAPLDAMRRSANLPPGASPHERMVNGAQRALSFITNFMLPFVRTATNSLYQRVWRRTPLTVLDPHTVADLNSGGPKADIAMGRIMLGTASVALAWSAAERGIISGEGPDNRNKKDIKMATGWRPRSVKVEDGDGTRYNINPGLGNRLNPFDMNSQVATMVAGLHEAYKKGANEGQVATGMKMAVYSSIKSLLDNAWLGDIAGDIETFTAPGQYGVDRRDQWVANQITSFTPNLLGQIARTQDQGQPFTTNPGDLGQTIEDTFKSKIPGMRETLPDRMTPLGTPVQSGATLAGQSTGLLPQGNRITGGAHIRQTTDEAELEIARLDDLFEESLVTPVKRTIKVNGESIKLTNQEFSEYQELAGREIVETLRDMMASDDWANMDDEERASWLKKMQPKAKKRVREYLFSGDSGNDGDE